MRKSWTLFAASLAFVLGSWSTANAQSSADPQPQSDADTHARTEWDEHRGPVAKDREDEYRTDTFETWIRIEPTFGWLLPDGGTRITSTPMLGFRLNFDAADVVQCGLSIDGSVRSAFGHTLGDRRLTSAEIGQTATLMTNPADGIPGYIVHPAIYVGYKNPDLRAGPLQAIIGIDVGAFMFHDYSRDFLPVGGGAIEHAEFTKTAGDFPKNVEYVFEAGPYLRFDFDLGENFKLGFDFKVHFPLYSFNKKDEPSVISNMEGSKFSFDHVIFEPSIYFAIAF